MKKKYFKFATLPCAVAVALLGGSVLFSCSGDDETGVEESDFSASQFETLASRRMTRSAEGQIDRPLIRVRKFDIESGEMTLCQGVQGKLCASCSGGPDATTTFVGFYAEVTHVDSSRIVNKPTFYVSDPRIPAIAGYGDKTFYANVLYKGGNRDQAC